MFREQALRWDIKHEPKTYKNTRMKQKNIKEKKHIQIQNKKDWIFILFFNVTLLLFLLWFIPKHYSTMFLLLIVIWIEHNRLLCRLFSNYIHTYTVCSENLSQFLLHPLISFFSPFFAMCHCNLTKTESSTQIELRALDTTEMVP